MWASFDEDHNRILAEILNELPGVQCEIRTPFVTIYYDTEVALQRVHKVWRRTQDWLEIDRAPES